MEDKTDTPIAVKVEEHCVILTYFRGDISSMVDAHFSRALSKVTKAKAEAARPKKIRKLIKTEDSSSCQARAADLYSEPQVTPAAGRPLVYGRDANSPSPWHSFAARTGDAAGLPSIAYSLSPEGLSLTGQQYANSLLNLLHSDRSEMGPSMASTSKPELLPSWTMPQGFRDSMDPPAAFEPGRHLDKKDLYWY